MGRPDPARRPGQIADWWWQFSFCGITSSMPAKAPKSIEAFLAVIEACSTPQELFEVYADEIKREGYDNFVFARLGANMAPSEVPYGNLPESVAKAYLQERMWEHDPIIEATQNAFVPFTWIDVMMRRSHSESAKRVMESGLQHGVQGGLTMPFHGPGGVCDLVSVSMRDKKLLDPNRIAAVNVKTYATVQRYIVLTMGQHATGPWTGLAQKPSTPTVEASMTRNHPQHGECVGVISDSECRALALVDIAWRRYGAGFLSLNRRVPDIVGEDMLSRFMERGLIEEEPDDFRFHYVFRPSPVGQSHLKLCPCVSEWREEVWTKYVEKHERPQD